MYMITIWLKLLLISGEKNYTSLSVTSQAADTGFENKKWLDRYVAVPKLPFMHVCPSSHFTPTPLLLSAEGNCTFRISTGECYQFIKRHQDDFQTIIRIMPSSEPHFHLDELKQQLEWNVSPEKA